MVVTVHIHASYTNAVKRFRKLVVYAVSAVLVDSIQSLVGTDVIAVLPFYYGIDYFSFHTYRTVYILKRRFCHAQKSESGRCKPEISLIVIEHVVDGVIELVCVKKVVSSLIDVSDSGVGRNKKRSVSNIIQAVYIIDALAADFFSEFERFTRDIIAVNLVCSGT